MKALIGRYVIRGDGGCFTLYRIDTVQDSTKAKAANIGKSREVVLGYYSRLEHCVERLTREELCDAEIQTTQQLLDRLGDLVRALSELQPARLLAAPAADDNSTP